MKKIIYFITLLFWLVASTYPKICIMIWVKIIIIRQNRNMMRRL